MPARLQSRCRTATMPVSRIPPIQCLLTFEAVARLRSASRAAEDLCVTVSAVSHRLRQLESHLGVRLFSRSDFTPTAEGAVYLQQVGIALAALRELPGERAAMPRLRWRSRLRSVASS